MTYTDTYPPVLAPDPTDEQLEDFVDEFCLDPSDERALLWIYLGPDGVPVAPPVAVGGLPVEPDRDRVGTIAVRVVEVAAWVDATAVLLVWQSPDESLSASCDDQRWAAAILSVIEPGDLTVLPPMRRTPSDVRPLLPVG